MWPIKHLNSGAFKRYMQQEDKHHKKLTIENQLGNRYK